MSAHADFFNLKTNKMAYIKSEQVKEMRNKIKELFPSKNGWKFSIVRLDYSCLSVKILRAPVDLAYNKAEGNKHFNVNHYHLDRYEKDEVREVFEKITNICMQGNFDNSDSMTDYFHVGWYFSLSVGEWNKDFEFIEKTKI